MFGISFDRNTIINLIYTGSLCLLIYLSGVILYSNLFIFSAQYTVEVQVFKILVASVHCLVFFLPIYLVKSHSRFLKLIGLLILLLYFFYAIFLTSYFSYFGFVPEIYSFGMSNTRDVAEVSGHYFRQVFGASEIALLLTMVTLFYLLSRERIGGQPVRLGRESLLVLLLPLALLILMRMQYGSPIRTAEKGNVSFVRQFGIPAFVYFSTNEWLNFSSGYVAQETSYPGKVASIVYQDQGSESAFAQLPSNIQRALVIQIESFDIEAMNAALNGVDVMPFVRELRESCLNYTNYYTAKSVGGSSDAEFSLATGLVPSSKLPSIRYANFAKISTLYDRLQRDNVETYFAHNNHIGFYGRNLAYPTMDSVHHRFQSPAEDISERAFAEETLAHALENSDRFFYYFFNYQSHGPYMGYSEATAEKFSINNSFDLAKNYMATMHEVDQMIESVFSMQRSDFEDGQSVFILTADHPSGLHTDSSLTSRTHIPMLVCHNSFEKKEINKVSSGVDLYPTILEIFGADPDTRTIGQSMLRNGRGAVLYPTGKLLYRDEGMSLKIDDCGEKCLKFFDYTNQYIKLSD